MAALTNKISQLTGVGKGKVLVQGDNDVVIVAAVRTAITKVCTAPTGPLACTS